MSSYNELRLPPHGGGPAPAGLPGLPAASLPHIPRVRPASSPGRLFLQTIQRWRGLRPGAGVPPVRHQQPRGEDELQRDPCRPHSRPHRHLHRHRVRQPAGASRLQKPRVAGGAQHHRLQLPGDPGQSLPWTDQTKESQHQVRHGGSPHLHQGIFRGSRQPPEAGPQWQQSETRRDRHPLLDAKLGLPQLVPDRARLRVRPGTVHCGQPGKLPEERQEPRPVRQHDHHHL